MIKYITCSKKLTYAKAYNDTLHWGCTTLKVIQIKNYAGILLLQSRFIERLSLTTARYKINVIDYSRDTKDAQRGVYTVACIITTHDTKYLLELIITSENMVKWFGIKGE